MPPKKKTIRKFPKSAGPKRNSGSREESAGLWFERLVKLQARLRAANGCPWDVEQTHLTLRTYLIEEAYEVLEALESGDDAKFAEELGDLLLQVVFHAQIATDVEARNVRVGTMYIPVSEEWDSGLRIRRVQR